MKKKKHSERAFTLSEVIITLVVLGIVAAITVPMMSSNVHDKRWNVARQKAKATIGEAFRLMMVNGEITTTNSDNTPRTTEQMVTKILPKYLKLEKTCTPANYSQCGFPATVKTPRGGSIGVTPNNYKWTELSDAPVVNAQPTRLDSWGSYKQYPYSAYNTSYFFRTLDGFSVAFLYNPYCAVDEKEYYYNYSNVGVMFYRQFSMNAICLMGIYDMNGKAKPNKVGYDIGFVGSFYNGFKMQTVAVLPSEVDKAHNASGLTGSNVWQKLDNYCNNLSKDKEWIVPDRYEASLLALNYRLLENQKAPSHWLYTRTRANNVVVTIAMQNHSNLEWGSNATGPYVRCVRRTQMK